MTQHKPIKDISAEPSQSEVCVPSKAGGVLPTVSERISRIRSDLRLGLPCLLSDAGQRAVVVAVEPLRQERLDGLRALFGEPEAVLTANRANAMTGAAESVDNVKGVVRFQPPENADIAWFRELTNLGVDERAGADTVLKALQQGDASLQDMALTLIKTSELLPAALVFPLQPDQALPPDLWLTEVTLAELQTHAAHDPLFSAVASARLPIEANDDGQLHVFRDADGITEHYALVIGTPDPASPALVRLHSACFTGDVLGSLKCDCGPQLRAALAYMGEHGSGVLLYLNQEGRGIGLANKMRVYGLQAQGLDTVEANHHLGFADDERDFRVAAVMLRQLGFETIRLLTNNPAKVTSFRDNGIQVSEQLPLRVGKNSHNSAYLAVKALKSGHTL